MIEGRDRAGKPSCPWNLSLDVLLKRGPLHEYEKAVSFLTHALLQQGIHGRRLNRFFFNLVSNAVAL